MPRGFTQIVTGLLYQQSVFPVGLAHRANWVLVSALYAKLIPILICHAPHHAIPALRIPSPLQVVPLLQTASVWKDLVKVSKQNKISAPSVWPQVILQAALVTALFARRAH